MCLVLLLQQMVSRVASSRIRGFFILVCGFCLHGKGRLFSNRLVNWRGKLWFCIVVWCIFYIFAHDMISIDNLGVEFSARPLFAGISYVVNDRDRIALVGKNGAGKSTMLKIIAGVEVETIPFDWSERAYEKAYDIIYKRIKAKMHSVKGTYKESQRQVF